MTVTSLKKLNIWGTPVPGVLSSVLPSSSSWHLWQRSSKMALGRSRACRLHAVIFMLTMILCTSFVAASSQGKNAEYRARGGGRLLLA
jgi:hypothetical protein